MPRSFLHYWSDAICEDAMDNGDDGTPLGYCAGDDPLFGKVSAGDRMYAINVGMGELYLIARMDVDEVTGSPTRAWRRARDRAQDARFHVIGKKGSGTPQYFMHVLPRDQVRLLQMLDAASGETQPVWNGGVQRSRLRGLHEIDARSAAVLDAFLALPYEGRDEEDMDEFGDDDDLVISDGEVRDIMAQYDNDEQNERVALTAVAAARRELETRGFTYEGPADAVDLGYDFSVSRGGDPQRVIVRGTVDIAPAFLIDDTSMLLLEDDSSVLLCVVTGVLGPRRSVTVMTSDEFFDDYDTRPVLHAARPAE
jgi:hypothetical protein